MSADPYRYFRVEARELLEQLGSGVLELERGPAAVELVARLLRAAHTLKGAARVVKRVEIGAAAHTLEDRLAPLRDGGVTASRAEIDAMLAELDRIAALVAELPGAPVRESTPARAPAEEVLRAVRIDVEEIEGVLAGIAEAQVQVGTLRGIAADTERAGHLAELLGAQLGGGRAAVGSRAQALAEELREAIARIGRRHGDALDRLASEVEQLRESAERLRLVPASSVFAPLERIARDSAGGRSVRLVGRGGEVRVDADVLVDVQSALVQLVRNAIAHGIESPPVRLARGKPSEGTITIEVERRGGRIAFVCRDDGGGIDLAAVRRRVAAQGLPGGGTDDELIAALLRGGVTTAAQVSDLAGRGVGLDVVRAAAARLGGTLAVVTTAGEGTSFELVVPVSMSSIDALLVETAGITAAIPLDAVRRSIRHPASAVASGPDGETLADDGEVLPRISLMRVLGVGDTDDAPSRSAVVIAHGTGRAAIAIDRVRGIASIVVRPLPRLAPADPCVAGSWLDERGDPRMVLDPAGLLAWAQRGVPEPRPRRPTILPILVIDDSLTTRMLEQSILESAGYRVEIAVSAEEALDKARLASYALFLVDVEMPGIDGFEFVARTRDDPRLRQVPAILVTSRDAPADRARGRAVGAADYVVKGEFDQNALLQTIARLVG